MQKSLRGIRQALIRISSRTTIPLSLTVSLIRLMFYYRVLRKAQVVVIMSEGGFGHTITGPDIARRLFPDRRCVFIGLSEYKRHNWKAASIWPDIRVVFLPLNVGVDIGGRSIALPMNELEWLKEFLTNIIRRFISLVAGQNVLFMSLDQLYRSIPVPDEMRILSDRRTHSSWSWPIHYFRLQRDVPASPVRVPRKWYAQIRNRLNKAISSFDSAKQVRLCCLYLRQKGDNSADITDYMRVGSNLEAYLPAVKLLNRAGFQVLLTGDVLLNRKLYQECHGLLVDAKNLGVKNDLFNLFAATEAEIFIGETGGGAWLPGLNGIPRLLLNGFPYGYGLPNSWVYYKTVRDPSGRLVHYSKLFSDHPFDYELEGMTIHNNSSEEICEAVSSFIEDVSKGKEGDLNARIIEQLPDHLWIKHAKSARLSPAWLKLYENVEGDGIEKQKFKAETR
jgi:putative glycosyltransferase (TIGR04372 family)